MSWQEQEKGRLWDGTRWGTSGSIPWDGSAETFLPSGGQDPRVPTRSTSRAKFVSGSSPPPHMPCHEIASRMLIATLLMPLRGNVIMHGAVVVPGKE